MNASLTPQANAEPQMDTASLKKFAQSARRQLIETVSSKLERVLTEGSLARRESSAAITKLEDQIAKSSPEQVIEQVAYTWFNRFCALRFMDVNGYTRIGIVSPPEGFVQPEILSDAKQGLIDDQWKVDREQVNGLLDQTVASTSPEQEAYQALLVAACNHYHTTLPFLFEEIIDYTELLIPDDLLSDESILERTRQALTPTACQNVEVIGWLYQFYISEKKDDVFAALKKGKKITPENIPAATQLFTPHWIVRYLVENSLGRLWMMNHPDSRLVEQMDYYIRPEEPESDFLRISSPEEIKICDPACGSGHMLTYAFDLLYAIYEEQGYPSTDIPRLILTHNLYGIEIDQRAGALAAFALTMKAREKYRRFLTSGKVVQPNICVLENISIDPEDLSAYMDKVGRDLFSEGLVGVVNQWEEADNFGSLIRPLVTDVSEVLQILETKKFFSRDEEAAFLAPVHQKVLKTLRQTDYLSPKYHVVVANPPYMGSNGMNAAIRAFAKKNFPGSKSDLFAIMTERFLKLIVDRGLSGLMTPFVWMFIGSFEHLRRQLSQENTLRCLVLPEYHAFFDSAYVPICAFVVEKNKTNGTPTAFIDLSRFYGQERQPVMTLEAIEQGSECEWFFNVRGEEFKAIPGAPLAFTASENLRGAFKSGRPLGEIGSPKKGMATGDNQRFIRKWYEVALDHSSIHERKKSGARWFPYNTGGEYRKWYGNVEDVVDWKNDGEAIKGFVDDNGRQRSRPQNVDHSFAETISWTSLSSTFLGVRYYPDRFVNDQNGNFIVIPAADIPFVLSFLCTPIAVRLINLLNPTMHILVGNIRDLPLIDTPALRDQTNELATEAIGLAKNDWDSRETSWDFESFGLLVFSGVELTKGYEALRETAKNNVKRLHAIEQQNNQLFIETYKLSGELSASPSVAELTLTCNPAYRYDSDKSESELEALLLADTMREFISYAVGCMLGRYSLDKPGLILANGGETTDDYRQQIPEPTFAPDEDNVIPLLDGDWFEDDITERFKEFLKVTFGTEHYEENLTFLENSLYPDNLTGKKRKTIRDYFLKGFYNHHIKLYKKRPIYWLFSSPKGTFNALIYMHRYRPDTVSVVLNDYLREFQAKLKSKVDSLQHLSDQGGTDKAKKASALKEISKLKKQLTELEDYERDVLFPLAQQQIEIDLDDGVLTNYNKFGSALKKVTGLTGKNKK